MQEQISTHSDASFLPRSAGRANSMIGGKPVHLHRVIKDRSNSVIVASNGGISDKRPALLPIANASENGRGSIDSLLQGGPSGLLKMEKNSAAENDTKEFLRRRIKELEKEVLKLNNHIHQAELSIKNYRVSLSEKSPRIGFGTGRECSVQTDPDDTTQLQASLKVTQDKLATTVEELRAVKAAKDAMFSERKQLQEAGRRKEDFLLNTVQTNEDRLAQQAQRIRELEAQLEIGAVGALPASPSVTAAAPAAVEPNSQLERALEGMLGALTDTQKLRQELCALKGRVASEAAQLLNAMTGDYLAVLQRAQASTALSGNSSGISSAVKREEQMTREAALLRAQLQESHDQCQTLRVECSRLKAENSSLAQALAATVRETAEHCTNTEPGRTTCDASTCTAGASPVSTPLKPVQPPPAIEASMLMIDACASPLSPMVNRSYNAAAACAAAAIQADLHVQAKLRLAEREAEMAALLTRAEKDRALLMQQSEDLDALRQRLLAERERYDAICREQEQQLARSTALSAGHQQRADAYQQRLGQAAQALHSLQEVHAAELKAVRHEAHIKDLQRVAKEREADIEKDRLQIELKHIKEVQGILTFALSTAEQSLNDVQPHVVVKLVQGREKRLKLLEQATQGRRRDLDQRSADTCAVNSAHLDGFQKKAATNNVAAKEMTHAATKRLLGLLQLEGPAPVPAALPLGRSGSGAVVGGAV